MSDAQAAPADAPAAEPSVVVFGRDEAGKPHASWFDAESADLAVKAAELMNMRVLRAETEEQKALARQLARGWVFATGRAFTPFARENLYSKLVELAGGATGLAAVQASDATTADASAAAASSLDGVQAPAAASNEPKGTDGDPAKPNEPSTLLPRLAPSVSPCPEDWDEIGIGSLVLATAGIDEGWWESLVIGVNGETFTLKWRDYPRERTFIRRRTELALLPVNAR